MVPEKVKAELKRFLNPKQIEEFSKQFDTYEKRVRLAVKHFDVKGREARALGQEKLDKFASQLRRTSQQLEKQLLTFINEEGRVINKGLQELFVYFRSLAVAPKQAAAVKKPASKKPKAKPKTKSRSTAHAHAAHAH